MRYRIALLYLVLMSSLPFLISLNAADVRKVYSEKPLVGTEHLTRSPEGKYATKAPSPPKHNQVGTIVDSTYYDYQCNGTLPSRIVTIGDSALHVTAMISPDVTFIQRGMKYIYYIDGIFLNYGYVEGSGTGDQRGGFGSIVGYYAPQTGLGNIAILALHSNLAGQPFGPHWYSFQDAFQGIGAFVGIEGPPGSGTDPCDAFLWPSIYAVNDLTGHMAMVGMTATFFCSGGFDDIMVTHKTFDDPAWGFPVLLDTLDDPSAWNFGPNIPRLSGADNGLMAVVSSEFGTNVYGWISADGGVTWGNRINISGFPIGPHKVPPDTTSTEYRPLQNNAISVSPEGVPHVVWTAYQAQGSPIDSIYTPGLDALFQYRTKLEHWDPINGTTTVYRHPVGLADIATGTQFTYNVGHPSIGFGQTGDTVYVVYEGFVDADQDPTNGLFFGDIYVSMSADGGATWKDRVNVTRSPGSDDLYPGIARINPQGAFQELNGFRVGGFDGVNDFVMVYQNDDVAGTYLGGDESSANWDMLLVAPVDFDTSLAPTMALAGPTPGIAGMDNTFDVAGATPSEKVHFLYGVEPGTTTAPECPGVEVGILDPISGGFEIADGSGNASLTIFIPDGASGGSFLFQAIEKSDCKFSNLITYTFP